MATSLLWTLLFLGNVALLWLSLWQVVRTAVPDNLIKLIRVHPRAGIYL